MEENSEIERIRSVIELAMRLSTDSVTAASADSMPLLALQTVEQAQHLARCIAVFTTDDALADEMEQIVDESPVFLVSKVMAVRHGLERFTGDFADLEKRIWTLFYAGRRERSRVLQTLTRRKLI